MENKSGYLALIDELGLVEIDDIRSKDTTIALQPVNSEGVDKALSGQDGFAIFNDYRNVPVLSSFGPVYIGENRWAILSEIDEAEAFYAVNKLESYILGLSLIIV